MKANHIGIAFTVLAVVIATSASPAGAATVPITGWAVHNGTATPSGTPENPTFTPADAITLMAPFDPVTLASDGDFIQVKTTLTMNDRTGNLMSQNLNTQLRVGIFNGPPGAIVASDIPNRGFIIEYANSALAAPGGRLIREQTSATQVGPFVGPTNIGNGVADPEGDSIQGVNPGPVLFDLKLTRNGGMIDLVGSISGTDSVSGNPYLGTFSLPGYSSATHPANGTFTFNRIGLFLGGNADATSASLSDSSVTTVPEPASFAMLATALGTVLVTRRSRKEIEPSLAVDN